MTVEVCRAVAARMAALAVLVGAGLLTGLGPAGVALVRLLSLTA